MDTTQPSEFDPDATPATAGDAVTEEPSDAVAPGNGDVPDADLLATLESVDPADAPEVAERLATLLSDELES